MPNQRPERIQIQRLTLAQLVNWANAEVEETPRALDVWPFSYILALGVLSYYVGVDWVKTYVQDEHSPSVFLRASYFDTYKKNRHIGRIMELGECLFNLQRLPGIQEPDGDYPEEYDSFCSRLRKDIRKIEGTYLELEGLKLFALSSLKYRVMYDDDLERITYDTEVVLPSGVSACVEMKCCPDETTLSTAKILDKLNRARKQLPKDRCGIVLLKTPEEWEKDPNFVECVDRALTRFLRGTTRVGLVIIHVTRFEFSPTECHRTYMLREFPNSNSPHYHHFRTGFLRHRLNAHHPLWINFLRVQRDGSLAPPEED